MINKAIILGNLGRDPEIYYSPDGKAIATMSVATDEKWTGADGKPQSRTEWHRVVAFGALAEMIGKYYRKGKQAYVEGKNRTRKWIDKDGVDRYTGEIVANICRLTGPAPQLAPDGPPLESYGEDQGPPPGAKAAANRQEAPATPPDDDIPF